MVSGVRDAGWYGALPIQAFEEQDLDPSVDFDSVPPNKVVLIRGRGQMVYWKGCKVSVLEKDDQGNRKLEDKRDGQGILPDGTQLYITGGKIIDT